MSATQVRFQPGENVFRVFPPEPLPRERPTDEELHQKLETCRQQYSHQVCNSDSRESQMVTLGQIATLQMVLGESPDPNLPIICLM